MHIFVISAILSFFKDHFNEPTLTLLQILGALFVIFCRSLFSFFLEFLLNPTLTLPQSSSAHFLILSHPFFNFWGICNEPSPNLKTLTAVFVTIHDSFCFFGRIFKELNSNRNTKPCVRILLLSDIRSFFWGIPVPTS